MGRSGGAAGRSASTAQTPSRALWLRAGCCAFYVVVGIAFAACSVRPEWQRISSTAGMQVRSVTTSAFDHIVIANSRPGGHLSIYIEGDGTPWIRERRIAIDPTPANPLMLRLMVADARAAVYLGRPCYFGTATTPSCSPETWTNGRYADPVVQSMCDAADQLAAESGAETVGLVGYSGGGTLAVAMRGCVNDLTSITTIAANLDVEAWATYHNYAPLELPRQSAAPAAASETHWQCSTDAKVPPAVTDRYFEQNPAAVRIIVDHCSHETGWERHLSRIQASENPATSRGLSEQWGPGSEPGIRREHGSQSIPIEV